jgi:predicted AAA+ superfamily ATPase
MELDQYLVDNDLNKINDRLKEWLNKRENVVKSYFKIDNTDETLFNTRSYEHIESLIDTQYSNDLNIWNDQLKNYRVKGYPNIDKEIDNNDKTTKTIQNIEPLFSHYDVILKQINLNSMQKIIFNIFTNTYFDKKACQVILFCTGNGGTGKSEVAKAIENFFKHYNIAHKLSLSSSTSVSANLLSEASNYVFIIENFIKAVYLKAFLGRNQRSPCDNRLLISDFTYNAF